MRVNQKRMITVRRRKWVRKTLFLLLTVLGSSPAYCQLFSVGVKGGVPLSEAFQTFNSGHGGFTSDTWRYVVGPTVEIHLPFRLSIEVDALYRRTGYDSDFFFTTLTGPDFTHIASESSHTGVRLNNWQLPFLVKYEPTRRFLRPFVDTGVTYRYVSGTDKSSAQQSISAAVDNPNSAGFTVGGGVSLKVPFLKISPEIRYTRWGSNPISQTFVKSNGNQTDFLLGITF